MAVCSVCSQIKLSAEFPAIRRYTPGCCHPIPLICLRCLPARLGLGKEGVPAPACPTCRAVIPEDMRVVLQQQCDALFAVSLPEVISRPVLLVSLLTGATVELPFNPATNAAALREVLEKETGIPAKKQRLTCSGRDLPAFDLSKGRPATLEELGVRPGARLQLMVRIYNPELTREQAASRDSYGNVAGSVADLAEDGAFSYYPGLRVIGVLHLYTGFDFSLPTKALEQKGFELRRWTTPPPPQQFEKELAGCAQLWVVSDHTVHLSSRHLDSIKQFWERGRGVYIWGDNAPYYADANQVGELLLGLTLDGNDMGDQVLTACPDSSNGRGFRKHGITHGIDHLYEGITIAKVVPSSSAGAWDPVVRGSVGQVVVAACEQSGRRALIDGGFTRLYHKWDSAGTGRYVVNAATWLANVERFIEEFDG